jgi:hypothetical protein
MRESTETFYLDVYTYDCHIGYLPSPLTTRGNWATKDPLQLKYIPIDLLKIDSDIILIHSRHCVTSFAEVQPMFNITYGTPHSEQKKEFTIIAPKFKYHPHSARGTDFEIYCENMFTRTMIPM